MIPLIAVTASLSVFLFVLWYMRSKNEAEARIRSLGRHHQIVVEEQSAFSRRVTFPLIDAGVRVLMGVLPTSMISRARRWLTVAGDPMTLSQFFTIVLVTSTLLPVTYLVLVWVATSGSPSATALAPILLIAALGIFGPFFLLRRRAKARQTKIWRSMPNAIDLLTTCVEAGLSLDFALQRVAERYEGALSDEIHRMLREVALGRTRRDALLEMAARVDIPDLMTFVNSIVQAESLGTSIGGVLRVQARQMRLHRRQRAEQVARQAPVKMVFPLVLFLLPSLFIVTIGPVVLNVIDAFKS